MCGVFGRTTAQTREFEGIRYQVYVVDPAKEELKLFWKDETGQPFTTFRKLEANLNQKGNQLRFATNAGIYEPGFIPTGLHIENGRTLVPLNQKPVPPLKPGQYTPNFYLKPNGVFIIDETGPAVLETEEFARSGRKPHLGVQSGPLLLHQSRIHPAFRAGSTSRLLRNGVGVNREGKIVFLATERSEKGQINLHTFARLFLEWDCPNALYLDGDISEFYDRETHPEIQTTTSFAAIFAIVKKMD
tara:strand:+ start:7089 stop:7823 length:735 start_codon:yes stop_codon:yes gene_type:complete